ncbi:MAG: hypothetical protein L6R35_005268 [Caloplaca aegaea]|nr:MAG: hypothetical protein L6R35_005268 [Caloplaca aegaea]
MSSQRVDSPSNHGPIVSIVTWFLLAATVLAVVARVTTKIAISKRLTSDDFLIFLALAFSIGQAVAVSLQTSNGLGQHEAALSAFQMDNFYKFDYASNLLFILNLCFAKLSVLQLLRLVTPVKLHLRLVLGAGAFVILWSIASELASAFQCKTPNTWKVIGNQCFDRAAFWNAYGAFNLITEAALLILPLVILWKLQTQAKKKAVIYSCFASRIVVFSAIIVQLVYASRARGTADVTFDTWPTVLSAQIVQSLSIITACIPCLKPFLESLGTGMIRVDLRPRTKGQYGYDSHDLSNLSSKSSGKKEKSALSSNLSHHKHFRHLPDVSTVISANHDVRETDSDSQKSSARIIKYTRTWEVT